MQCGSIERKSALYEHAKQALWIILISTKGHHCWIFRCVCFFDLWAQASFIWTEEEAADISKSNSDKNKPYKKPQERENVHTLDFGLSFETVHMSIYRGNQHNVTCCDKSAAMAWNVILLRKKFLWLHYWVIKACSALTKSVSVVFPEKNEPWAQKSQVTTALFISTAAWSYDATVVRTGPDEASREPGLCALKRALRAKASPDILQVKLYSDRTMTCQQKRGFPHLSQWFLKASQKLCTSKHPTRTLGHRDICHWSQHMLISAHRGVPTTPKARLIPADHRPPGRSVS